MDKKLSRLLARRLIFSEMSSQYSSEEWELLLRQARATGVLSRLFFFWKKFGLFIPPAFLEPHLVSADKYWRSQKRIVSWELYNLQQVFDQLRIPLILLKGTAYSAANLNAGLGRIFSDIDILVPKQRLQEVKEALKWSGWLPEPLDSYDQKYYERWMHELPPMRHLQRGTVLDVHHNILPETCDLCPNAELLLKSAVNVPETNYWVLAPEDMVLHSACHLFWGGEFENSLRDLSDIDLLLREFSQKDSEFWQKLLQRARMLGMGKPLFYALRYAKRMLESPIPEDTVLASADCGPSMIKNKIMDVLFLNAFLPVHPSCENAMVTMARWLLYLRAHWLKMPWYLLVPHLSRKAWLSVVDKDKL